MSHNAFLSVSPLNNSSYSPTFTYLFLKFFTNNIPPLTDGMSSRFVRMNGLATPFQIFYSCVLNLKTGHPTFNPNVTTYRLFYGLIQSLSLMLTKVFAFQQTNNATSIELSVYISEIDVGIACIMGIQLFMLVAFYPHKDKCCWPRFEI